MRINIYSQELTDDVEIVSKDGVVCSKESGDDEDTVFYGVRFYLHSPDELHDDDDDDDRSAVTFWLPKSRRRREELALSFCRAAGYVLSNLGQYPPDPEADKDIEEILSPTPGSIHPRRFPLGLGETEVPPHTTICVQKESQLGFMPERLVCTKGDGLLIKKVTAGEKVLYEDEDGGCPVEAFAADSVLAGVNFARALEGEDRKYKSDFSVVVRNVSSEPLTFSGALIGLAIR